jgi:hypothetical protein
MRPVDGIVAGPGQWCLSNSDDEYLIHFENIDEVADLNILNESGRFRARWIDVKTGRFSPGGMFDAGKSSPLHVKTRVLWLSRTVTE